LLTTKAAIGTALMVAGAIVFAAVIAAAILIGVTAF